jgi:hypothetical protein
MWNPLPFSRCVLVRPWRVVELLEPFLINSICTFSFIDLDPFAIIVEIYNTITSLSLEIVWEPFGRQKNAQCPGTKTELVSKYSFTRASAKS